MSDRLLDLVGEIQKLHDELDREIAKKRKRLGFDLSGSVIRFEKAVIDRHRRLKTNALRYLIEADLLIVLTAPVIYALIVPIAVLDLSVTIYQHICFRAYGIARVRRGDYIAIDRQHLSYLNWIEALNCVYCSYANGIIAYAREIAGRTEKYWCPIKHALKVRDPHQYYFEFLDYGDADGYRARLEAFREALLRREKGDPGPG
jgi:hypothetical protein